MSNTNQKPLDTTQARDVWLAFELTAAFVDVEARGKLKTGTIDEDRRFHFNDVIIYPVVVAYHCAVSAVLCRVPNHLRHDHGGRFPARRV